MRSTRVSLGRLMGLVGVVALNLAASRLLTAYDEDPRRHPLLVIGVMPAAVVWQVALFRLVGTRGRRRAFWAGFLAAGLLVTLSFVWGNRCCATIGTAKDAATGRSRYVVVPGYFGGESLGLLWVGYFNAAGRCLPKLPPSRFVTAVAILAPQVLAASAGGLLAWSAARGRRGAGRSHVDCSVI